LIAFCSWLVYIQQFYPNIVLRLGSGFFKRGFNHRVFGLTWSGDFEYNEVEHRFADIKQGWQTSYPEQFMPDRKNIFSDGLHESGHVILNQAAHVSDQNGFSGEVLLKMIGVNNAPIVRSCTKENGVFYTSEVQAGEAVDVATEIFPVRKEKPLRWKVVKEGPQQHA
jgi:hypothetical protein